MKPFISLTKSFKLLIVGRKLKKDLMVDIISEGLGNSIFTPIRLIQIRFLEESETLTINISFLSLTDNEIYPT